MPYNTSNEDDIKKIKEREFAEREQELNDIRDILSRRSGERFFRKFFEKCYLFRNPMTGNCYVYYNCGIQSVAQMVFGDIVEAMCDKDPEVILKFMLIIKGETIDEK